MDQRLFELGLSPSATSLAVLLDGLAAFGPEVELAAARGRWSGTAAEFATAVAELADRGVISQLGDTVALNPERDWLPAD